MDRNIINFVPAWFGMTSTNWQIDVRGKAGDNGISGAGQVVYGNRPRWTASLAVLTRRPGYNLGWRSLTAQLRGRVNVLRVHLGDPFAPSLATVGVPVADQALARAGIPHGDGAGFSDDGGYSQTPSTTALAAAAIGATSINFDGDAVGNALQGGHLFSIDDWLYQATGVAGAGDSSVVTFEPPLRAAVAAGDELALDATALMALTDDLQGALELQPGLVGNPSLQLVEWVGPDR